MQTYPDLRVIPLGILFLLDRSLVNYTISSFVKGRGNQIIRTLLRLASDISGGWRIADFHGKRRYP